jgi:hypothetical protein
VSGTHVSARLITDYVAGGDGLLSTDEEWALEAHLESCAACRQRVAEAVAAGAPAVTALLDSVWTNVAVGAASRPARARSPLARWLRTWAAPSMLPWLAMTVLVIGIALVLDRSATAHLPSLVLLVAPVAPLLGVAAAWGRPTDPMHELIAGTPRSGLRMVLRRTAAVLVVVIPALGLASGFSAASPALWLLPCLAFTLGSLALGTVIGVLRAAIVLAEAWVLLVMLPSLLTEHLSPVLTPISLPGWAAVVAAAAVVLRLRASAFHRLGGRHS